MNQRIMPDIRPENVQLPEGKTLEQWIETRVARFKTRTLDWNALKFQADYDPKYRRAQMRYLGTGGAGVTTDDNCPPAENFTFSTMVLPAGCEGPLHLHTDAEEVFFVMRGERIRIMIEHLGHRSDVILSDRDLISVPPGVYRGLVNEGREEALMCVMIGSTKPETPSYPDTHPLSKIKRNKS